MWKVLWTLLKLLQEASSLIHWANLFKHFEWSNVPGVKLSSVSKLDDTFMSLQALSNLHYLFSGFMDYFWSFRNTTNAPIELSRARPDTSYTEQGVEVEYFDLWDSCMIKSLRLPKCGNHIRFLIQRVLSKRISNVLIPLPREVSAFDIFSSLSASVRAQRIYEGILDMVNN
ncbi:hypothetical protein Tco_0859099 [Tanacetum coccineum]|uniref:Maturase K n=1 Tax=Tanacetum coccineum TaxID=301880 RepID=A0ABQ5BED7_9ASTR